MSLVELLGVQDLGACQIPQTRQLCGCVILSYKICQVISWV